MLIQRQRGPAVEADGVLDSQPPHEQQHQGPDDLRSAQGPAGAAAAAVNDHICRHRIFKGQRPVDQSLFTCQALADPVHSNFSFPPEGSRRTIVCRGFQAGRFVAAGSPGSPAGRDLPFLLLLFTAYAKQVLLDDGRRAGNTGPLADQQVAAVAEAVADPAGQGELMFANVKVIIIP